MKTVKLTDKGQLTVPIEALKALKARKGTQFLLIQEGDRIVLVKASSVGRSLIDDLGGWEALAAPAFADVWGSEEDDVWDSA